MYNWDRNKIWLAAMLLLTSTASGSDDGIPPDSVIARGDALSQRLLLNPMEDVSAVEAGGWKLLDTYVKPAVNIEPKLGQTALTLGAAESEQTGAKGDFQVCGTVPGQPQTIGLWVHLSADANVARMGLQIYDAEDEALLHVIPADWTGWKWIEINASTGNLEQAYPQTGKNSAPDYPLKSIHIVWFTKTSGRTSLTADAVVALTQLQTASSDCTVDVSVREAVSESLPATASIAATNYASDQVLLNVRYSLQQDSSLYSQPLPDPVFGTNHALGVRSWLVVDGKIVDEPGSTDGKPWTSATTSWQREHYTEAFQWVDLGQVRNIRKMTWLSGDANHSWFVDVFASEDGETFHAVPGLEGVDHFQKWGWREFPLAAPFRAHIIKYRYRTNEKKEDVIRFPTELGIFDGVADESIGLPQVGPLVEEGALSLTVPARSFAVGALPLARPLRVGHYLLGLSVSGAGPEKLSYHHIFCASLERPEVVAGNSRIGLNAASPQLAPQLKELGIGWVRFENGKWPFVSSQPHQYSFTGDVAPWHLNLDEIYRTYHDAGLNVLTYMFLTPTWASSPPAGAADNMRLSFPPRDLSWYGEFCFQMAARYGSQKHPDDVLLTTDKRSGLDLVKYYEMWNEPNLNPSPEATWGGWAAPLDIYYDMMRFGAEEVKKADPRGGDERRLRRYVGRDGRPLAHISLCGRKMPARFCRRHQRTFLLRTGTAGNVPDGWQCQCHQLDHFPGESA